LAADWDIKKKDADSSGSEPAASSVDDDDFDLRGFIFVLVCGGILPIQVASSLITERLYREGCVELEASFYLELVAFSYGIANVVALCSSYSMVPLPN
jgi:hypothetical protein